MSDGKVVRVAMIVWNEFLNDARVLKEAQTLQQSGYQVTVFALHTPGKTKNREQLRDGIVVSRVARSPFWRWRKSTAPKIQEKLAGKGHLPTINFDLKHQLLRLIARTWTHLGLLSQMVMYRANVIHAHDVNTLPTAWLAARLSRARLVYDAHEISTSREGYNKLRNIVGSIESKLMPKTDANITTTDARAKYFARAYGISRPTVLQNRPRLTAPFKSNRIREELELTAPWPIIVYQGGLQQGRGLEKLIRTAPYVLQAYFVFIGSGRLTQHLDELSKGLNLQDRVHFIPTVALGDLPSYTSSADIGVQPIENTCLNHYTTDSNKLFEYLIAGLPVVATDFPEIRRIVLGHDVGLLVPPNDSESLAYALNSLIHNIQLRQSYAANARSAAKTLNWEEQESRLVSLYQQVLDPASVTSKAKS
ncbi:glycosyltransferase family 4 protein [Pseudomonas monteilii]|uniref:glycosyltransferase family 4 protein n=1 Tax=Pseudomonas monteilii TaxID=76759 RepID=UPI0009BFB608|nr:glycosyltransferase family 4 protein [Pseudomonas monteilii]